MECEKSDGQKEYQKFQRIEIHGRDPRRRSAMIETSPERTLGVEQKKVMSFVMMLSRRYVESIRSGSLIK